MPKDVVIKNEKRVFMVELNNLTKIHKRVLVVDDDPAILDILGQYMKIVGVWILSWRIAERRL